MHEFESERLFFKRLTELDVTDRYVEWLNDSEINQYLEIRFEVHDKEKVMDFVKTQNNLNNVYLWGIFVKESSKHIGNIKLGPINFHHQNADISLFIGEKYFWSKGIATEAIRRVSRNGFEKLLLEKIQAGCYETNRASLNAFLKVGYEIEGLQRSCVVSNGKRMGVYKLGVLPCELK